MTATDTLRPCRTGTQAKPPSITCDRRRGAEAQRALVVLASAMLEVDAARQSSPAWQVEARTI
jgi:hypothetical protein